MDAKSHSTSISAGVAVFGYLNASDVAGMVNRIFPVCITDSDALLPYIVYRGIKQEPYPTAPQHGPDGLLMQVDCLAEEYLEAVELAEAVRQVLERDAVRIPGVPEMSYCGLYDREEFYEADAFVERLIFKIVI